MKRLTWNRQLMWWLIFIGVMSIIPQVVPSGYVRIFVFANFLAIFAMSWDILSGYTGYVSFGHPFIIGIAGYTTAILGARLGLPFYATMPIGVAVGVGAGMFFFLPGLRLRGNYFCLVTLAYLIVIHNLVITIRPDLTGGTRGIFDIPVVVMGAVPNFYLSFFVMVAIAMGLWYIARSDMGQVFNAIRMDEDTVSTTGLNTLRFKLIAFALSALAASVGGVFFTHYLGSISPEGAFSVTFLLQIIIAALIGGQNTIIGPIMGAYFLTFFLEFLRPYLPGTPRFLLYSVIALGLYVYNTRGFYGMIQDVGNWYRGKRRKGVQHG